MRLYEYQAKRLFAEAGLPVPAGRVATTAEQARQAAEELGGRVAVKVQVPIGGRGKAGGIVVAEGPAKAAEAARRLLAMEIRGYPVHRVLIEEAVDVEAEFYLGVTVDRDRRANVAILSSAGGMDIEEIAARHPDRIAQVPVDAALGLRDFHARQLASRSGVPRELGAEVSRFLRSAYRLLQRYDASLVEINPLALVGGRLLALDGKMEIDDNALFRQESLAQWKEEDPGGDHPLEVAARRKNLAYVKLDGDVGIIGNGAGLVMTTLDMIQRNGGRPANFLDIGGGARAEVVKNALGIVLADPDVKAVLLNVFGGITRCDEVAKGLLEAMGGVALKVPVVVRLAGTREEEGRRLLEGTGLKTAASFQEAARQAVALAAERGAGA